METFYTPCMCSPTYKYKISSGSKKLTLHIRQFWKHNSNQYFVAEHETLFWFCIVDSSSSDINCALLWSVFSLNVYAVAQQVQNDL